MEGNRLFRRLFAILAIMAIACVMGGVMYLLDQREEAHKRALSDAYKQTSECFHEYEDPPDWCFP